MSNEPKSLGQLAFEAQHGRFAWAGTTQKERKAWEASASAVAAACTPKWISVEERFPEIGVTVFVLTKHGNIEKDEAWTHDKPRKNGPSNFRKYTVTHWTPIPSIPAAPDTEGEKK